MVVITTLQQSRPMERCRRQSLTNDMIIWMIAARNLCVVLAFCSCVVMLSFVPVFFMCHVRRTIVSSILLAFWSMINRMECSKDLQDGSDDISLLTIADYDL